MASRVRFLIGAVGLLIVYMVVPISTSDGILWRLALTVVVLAGVTIIIVRQVQHQLSRRGSPLWTLALAIVGGMLAFALADYMIAVAQPDQFAGLATRIDALYFALTTLATVGYGDVHAKGQLARTLVTGQIAFNILVLATAASVFASQLRSRARSER